MLFRSVPGLDAGYRKDARNYMEQFFRMAEKPGEVKKALVDGCVKRKTM